MESLTATQVQVLTFMGLLCIGPKLVHSITENQKQEAFIRFIRVKYGVKEAVHATLLLEKQGIMKRPSKQYRRLLQLLQLFRYFFGRYPEYVTTSVLFLFLVRFLRLLKNSRLTQEERDALVGVIIALIAWIMSIISPIFLPGMLSFLPSLFSMISSVIKDREVSFFMDRL